MRFRSFLSALALWGLFVSPVQARGVRHLQPTGKWVVEYAADTCRLAREFGEGNQRVTVIFEQFVPGDIFNLTFVGRSIVTGASKAAIRFGPHEMIDTENPVTPATVGSTPAILLGGFQRLAPTTEAENQAAKAAARNDEPYDYPPIGTARERAATFLELSRILPFDLVFETGPMDQPLEALHQCSWDTVKSWGLSVDEQKGLTRHAKPAVPSSTWFKPDDYPAAMLRQGYEGNVNFRVIVNADGTPQSCKVQSSTRPQEFDDVVCRQVMKHVRFKPALDANGKPVKSYYRQTAQFRLAS